MNEKRYYTIQLIFSAIIFIFIIIINSIFWPSNSIPDAIINELDSYYNSSVIMDISTNCNNKSNNILGYFGGIPEGRTYAKKPLKYCPYNPLNYFVGKCKKNPSGMIMINVIQLEVVMIKEILILIKINV